MTTKRIIVAMFSVITVTVPLCAGAKTSGALAVGSMTTQTFGFDRIAIIPGNPFYNVGKMFGNVKDYFSSDDALSRLETETNRVNEVAAELVTAYQVGSKNNKLMLKALSEYQQAVYAYAIALSHVTVSDLSPAAQATISTTIAHHSRFIDDISGWQLRTNAQAVVLRDLAEKMNSVTVLAFNSLIKSDLFLAKATEGLTTKSAIEQIRTAETLNVLAKAAANSGNTTIAKELLDVRTQILQTVATQNQSEVVAGLGSIAGSASERLQTILFLSNTTQLQNNAALVDLKNQLLIKAF